MFDERFARLYRYELPSEFPLTSPYTGIVHNLWGPKNDALTQTSSRRKWPVAAAGSLAAFTFIPRVGFSTTTLASVLDSLVRVSRRVGKNHFDKVAQGPSSRTAPDQRAGTQAPPPTTPRWGRLTSPPPLPPLALLLVSRPRSPSPLPS